jgi:hypothetical protein
MFWTLFVGRLLEYYARELEDLICKEGLRRRLAHSAFLVPSTVITGPPSTCLTFSPDRSMGSLQGQQVRTLHHLTLSVLVWSDF